MGERGPHRGHGRGTLGTVLLPVPLRSVRGVQAVGDRAYPARASDDAVAAFATAGVPLVQPGRVPQCVHGFTPAVSPAPACRPCRLVRRPLLVGRLVRHPGGPTDLFPGRAALAAGDHRAHEQGASRIHPDARGRTEADQELRGVSLRSAIRAPYSAGDRIAPSRTPKTSPAPQRLVAAWTWLRWIRMSYAWVMARVGSGSFLKDEPAS